MIFGRNVAEIPCFRNSFLYGLSGGVGIGFCTFLGTSRPMLSSHTGFGSFMVITMSYWCFCRYQWSKQRFNAAQLKEAMKKHILEEGTGKDLKKKEKTV